MGTLPWQKRPTFDQTVLFLLNYVLPMEKWHGGAWRHYPSCDKLLAAGIIVAGDMVDQGSMTMCKPLVRVLGAEYQLDVNDLRMVSDHIFEEIISLTRTSEEKRGRDFSSLLNECRHNTTWQHDRNMNRGRDSP